MPDAGQQYSFERHCQVRGLRAGGHAVGHRRVARLMREEGLQTEHQASFRQGGEAIKQATSRRTKITSHLSDRKGLFISNSGQAAKRIVACPSGICEIPTFLNIQHEDIDELHKTAIGYGGH
jgi:hypothetical protein